MEEPQKTAMRVGGVEILKCNGREGLYVKNNN